MQLVLNKRLLDPQRLDNRPFVRVRVAGVGTDSFDDKPEADALIDTGFNDLVMLPRRLMRHLSPDYLIRLAEEECPQIDGKPHRDTYTTLRLQVAGDPGQCWEVAPEYVCFYDRRPYGLIGMRLLIENKASLLVDGRRQQFSLDV